jgi:transmembrane sensor
MEEKNKSQSELIRIKQEASDWVAKQDHGFTPAEQDAFFEWLAADPRHSDCYSERQIMWKDLDVLIEWRPEHSVEPNPDLLVVRRTATIIKWVGIISTLAAVFVIGLLVKNPWINPGENEAILLTSSQGALFYEYHVMEDGSIIELNRGAQLSVIYSKDKRLVNLMNGEAHFTVAKNPNRPFVVQARNTVVKAVGTAFNVSLNSEEIEVLVTEGRVLVDASLPHTEESENIKGINPSQELVAGQGSRLSLIEKNASVRIENFSIEQINERLAWKNEALEFTATPLSEVILEFNRRNHTQLVINDAVLKNRSITATLRPNNLEGFIELLELTLDVRMEREGDSKIVLYSR